jgi:sporulation protein YlmC with PRC-barrel domain
VQVNPGGPDDPRNRNSNEKEEQKMNKTVKILMLISIFSLFLFGTNTVFAKGWTKGEAGAVYHPMGDRYEASWLIGQRVDGRAGNYLGQISNLVIDQTNDRVALVVLSNVPGFGADQVAIPYGCLERNDNHTFTVRFPIMAIASVNNREDPDLYLLKQYPTDSPLYHIPQPIDPNWVAEVYRTYGLGAPYWTERGERAPSAADFYQSTQLIGSRVQSPRGEVDAWVSDLVINSSNGHIPLLILSNVKGRNDNLVAVPFDALRRTGKYPYALNIAGDKLASAPAFHRSDLHKRGYVQQVDRFFSLRPSWTEKGHVRNMDPYRWGGEAQDF